MKCLKILLLIFSAIFYETLSLECGRANQGVGNVIGGSDVNPHQFPWHAAMLRNTGSKYSLHCGAVIVSNTQLLTAAHCIQNKGKKEKFLARDFRIAVGVHDLNDQFEIGKEIKSVKSISVHPDWNPNTVNFDADIAIIILEKQINFNNYIQPICLWDYNSSPSASSGVIVGYGKSEDETKIHENIPKKLVVPIHSQADCFLTNPRLAEISSRRTFCAGSGSGTGACVGDSGSGLYIQISGSYFLRGIVSSSLRRDFSCDVNAYSVYTDVIQFKSWIKSDTTIAIASTKPTYECGIMSSSSGLIQKGYYANRREFPWMAIIDARFRTSGALISSKHVVVAASSVAYWNSTKIYNILSPSQIDVVLGAIQVDDENSLKIKPSRVVIHPECRVIDGFSPILNPQFAVLVLSRQLLSFSEGIKPICLWGLNRDSRIADGSVLYAVGYGHGITGEVTNARKYAKMSKITNDKCIENYSNSLYRDFMRESNTFCAVGNADGQPCHKDESIFMKSDGRWFLRGFSISRFPDTNNPQSCAWGYPVLYEDAAQYTQWLQSFIDN